jgi:hypothetical protein
VATLKVAVFRNALPSGLEEMYQAFGEIYSLQQQNRRRLVSEDGNCDNICFRLLLVFRRVRQNREKRGLVSFIFFKSNVHGTAHR